MTESEEKIIIPNETEGMGLYQFQYQTNGDHYSWHYFNGNSDFSMGYHWSDLPGSWIRLRFEGTSINLYGHLGPDMGQAAFSLDNLPESLCDCHAPQKETDALLFHSSNLAPGFHDLIIRVCQGIGMTRPVAVNYAEVYTIPSQTVITPENGDCFPHSYSENEHTLQFWGFRAALYGTPSASPFYLNNGVVTMSYEADSIVTPVLPDGLHTLRLPADFYLEKALISKKAFAVEINDTNPDINILDMLYSEGLDLLVKHENLYLADAHVCRSADAFVTISFFGCQIEVYGVKGPECGKITVNMDCVSDVTADCFSPEINYHTLLYRSAPLPEGRHTAILRVTGLHNTKASDSLIIIDRFSILTRTPPVILSCIDPCRSFQTVENFGVSSGWTIDPICSKWSEAKKNELADLLYSCEKGIGLSCFRFDLGAGSRISDKERINGDSLWRATDCFQNSQDASFSWNNQQGQQWMMRAAKQREVPQYVAYVHSPPFWMTKNGHTQCDPDTGSTNLLPGKEQDFAKFLATVLSQFREAGIPFDFISPVNECGWCWEFPGVHEEGCRMNNNDMQKVFLSLSEELKLHGLPEKILGPESETIDALAGHLDHFMGNPDLRQSLSNCASAHSYFTDLFETVGISSRLKLADKLKEYASLQYWQTEYCFMGTGRGETRDYGMTPALWLAKTLYYDLVLLNASAWQWWLSISPGDFVWKDGLIYTDWRQDGDEENIIASKMLWVFGNFSRFIRPKAVRLALSGAETSGELLSSAFQNADNSIVSVWINCSCCERLVKLDRSYQPFSGTLIYLTDSRPENDLTLNKSLLSSDQILRLPARSVVTAVTS